MLAKLLMNIKQKTNHWYRQSPLKLVADGTYLMNQAAMSSRAGVAGLSSYVLGSASMT